ncbi:hypothetical protein VNO77_22733 [Canavalia gladiata]|uniref:S-protein homolog n=1 Tax=Canavalia gladiata TaxID=3824 RepID=A0AAN9L349_CANGL
MGADMQGSAKIVRLMSMLLVIELFTPLVSGTTQFCVKYKTGYGNNMTFHCQSKDEDLVKVSITHRVEYGSDYSNKVTATSLFYCELQRKSVKLYIFEDYSFGRDNVQCDALCEWLATVEGIGLKEQNGYWELVFYWLNRMISRNSICISC